MNRRPSSAILVGLVALVLGCSRTDRGNQSVADAASADANVDTTGVAPVQHGVRLVAVAIDPDSGTPRASITERVPESAPEREELGRALDEIQPVLAGTSQHARLGPHLLEFVTRAWSASHPLEAAPKGWRFRGRHPTELRQLGRSCASVETTVSIEPPRYLISILTANVERGDNPP